VGGGGTGGGAERHTDVTPVTGPSAYFPLTTDDVLSCIQDAERSDVETSTALEASHDPPVAAMLSPSAQYVAEKKRNIAGS
jgi:hypothetical protein